MELTELFKNIFNKSKKENITSIALSNKERFNNAIEFAYNVLEKNKKVNSKLTYERHPLLDLISLLGRDVQNKYITKVIFSNNPYQKYESNDRMLSELFFDTSSLIGDEITFGKILTSSQNIKRTVSLCRDFVLAWPLDRNDLISTISCIGSGRYNGSWKQDNNHQIILLLPIGFSIVTSGGNHSISAGIAQGEGEIEIDSACDISTVYDYVYCDGEYYRRKDNNSEISPVRNIEMAIIFEVGKIMRDNGISF